MNMKKRIHEKARSFLILLLTLGLQQAIAKPTASVSSTTNAKCNGTATGSITVSFSHTASTKFTIELDSAGTVIRTHYTALAALSGSHTFNNVRAKTYTVHVKENNTSSSTTLTGITVTQPAALVLSVDGSSNLSTKCKDSSSGKIVMRVSGSTYSVNTTLRKTRAGLKEEMIAKKITEYSSKTPNSLYQYYYYRLHSIGFIRNVPAKNFS
jgi:hypothetical protein